jgi:hypothetical protein
MIKVIIAGGRDFDNYDLMCEKLKTYIGDGPVVIICGGARGADTLGERWANEHAGKIVKAFMRMEADWDTHGKAAGPLRNEAMAEEADCLVAFWDGESRGTKHMIETMEKLGKPTRVVNYVHRTKA